VTDEDVDALLGPDGALSRVLPAYEHRPQQLAMARAVGRALTQGSRLVVEAGTGTGKTLAYLVPAALSGKRVVISTATRNLQDQLFLKDVPLLRDEAGLAFRAALLKGRNNYLCLQRFEQFEARPLFPTPADAAHWPAFRDWGLSTGTGDRAETQIPDSWAAWPQVSTTSDACLGSKCPHLDTCYVTRARRTAEECQVVVVNHALFFADLALRARGGVDLRVLPHYDAVIFDEAHALEDVATEYFGLSVSWQRVTGLAHDAMGALEPLDVRAGAVSALALKLKSQADTFFPDLAASLGLAEGRDAQLTPKALESVRADAARLEETLGGLAALLDPEDADVGALHRRAAETKDSLATILRADDESHVFWAEARGRSVAVRAAPIDIGQSLAEHLYSQVDSVVFTSATLAVGEGRDAFSFAAERFGLTPKSFEARRLDSPFDYAHQAALYVPRELPEPSSPQWTQAFDEEVKRLLALTHGRAFLLFTSLKQMDLVHALVAPGLDTQVLKQGERPRRMLLEAFMERPSVLFASQSFWEGVDVPGSALSLVVIDRLPFAPPNEPLQAARMEAVRRRGGNPFDEFQVPQAALALRQGFGRLIRTRTDRGIVALGDVRCLTKRYGKVFLNSLPPAARFSRFDELEGWWGAPPAPR
jgi:ATP-dependent DNA helicase DinG